MDIVHFLGSEPTRPAWACGVEAGEEEIMKLSSLPPLALGTVFSDMVISLSLNKGLLRHLLCPRGTHIRQAINNHANSLQEVRSVQADRRPLQRELHSKIFVRYNYWLLESISVYLGQGNSFRLLGT